MNKKINSISSNISFSNNDLNDDEFNFPQNISELVFQCNKNPEKNDFYFPGISREQSIIKQNSLEINEHFTDKLEKEASSDEYETEEEEYFNLKIDKIVKVKHVLNKIKKIKNYKVKRIDNNDVEVIEKLHKVFSEFIFPKCNIDHLNKEDKNKMTSILLGNKFYHTEELPEIGTNMFFENTSEGLNYLGKSNYYYKATKIKRTFKKKKAEVKKLKTEINEGVKDKILSLIGGGDSKSFNGIKSLSRKLKILFSSFQSIPKLSIS